MQIRRLDSGYDASMTNAPGLVGTLLCAFNVWRFNVVYAWEGDDDVRDDQPRSGWWWYHHDHDHDAEKKDDYTEVDDDHDDSLMSATKKAVQEGSDREDNDGNSHNGVLGNQYDEVEYNREDEIVGRAVIMMRNVKPMQWLRPHLVGNGNADANPAKRTRRRISGMIWIAKSH